MAKAAEEFLDYAEPYRKYGEKIQLKIDHSLRVMDLCRNLAESLGLDGRETELAAVCGLLHDIGRFEQYRRYQTYNDLRSVDHGDLGAEVLGGDRLIERFSENGRGTILQAVRYHNKYRVPDTLGEKSRRFAGITRDADKIDIFFLSAEGELVTPTKGSAMSYPVYRSLLDHKRIRKQDAGTKADEIAVRLGFVFDLNCKRSFEIIDENDYIHRMIAVQTEETPNAGLKKQLEELGEYIGRYVKERAAGPVTEPVYKQ